jgi:hypothetical protein
VTSNAVTNVETVATSRTSPLGAEVQRHREAQVVVRPAARGRQAVALKFLDQRVDAWMRATVAQAVLDVAPPIVEVHDARRHTLRMQRDAQYVDRRLEQRGRETGRR